MNKGRFVVPFKIVEGSAISAFKDLSMTLENM